MRRVVVTGIGAITPLGGDIRTSWKRLIEGKSGIKKIEKFNVDDLNCRVAAQIPLIDEDEYGFDPDKYMDSRDRKRVDPFILYGMSAAIQAIEDSGWNAQSEEEKIATGVLIGSGIGGLSAIESGSIAVETKGVRRLSPFFIPSSLINLVSGQLSIKYGYKGPNHAVVTACSTGAHAIGDAARLIMLNDADVMIAGGTEAPICKIGMAGFDVAKALSSSHNDNPPTASRPWDKGRDGFVMGEGAGVVVLEELEHAKKRGARIYAEIVGYGMSGDGYHITAPHPEGDGAFRSMHNAIKRAGISHNDIGYINAHGTSTPLGDLIELKAMKRLYGEDIKQVSISSTKSSIGHLLGAAGGVEALFSILALQDSILPPTLNLENPDEGCENIDLVPNIAKEKKIELVLSNSFGFGGTNASLVFKKFDG